MTREVQGIPPAPRRVRWRAVRWQRWPLCLVGLVLLVYGGLFAWMLFLAFGGGPSDQARLDAGPREQAPGKVTKLQPGSGQFDGVPADRVQFAFTHRGIDMDGACFAKEGTFREGQEVQVELLPEEPHVARIAGTRLHLLPPWLRPGLAVETTVLPGLALLLAWLYTALSVRNTMARGDVAVADVESVRRVRYVLPAMIHVTYRFRDHHAALRRGSHWVPLRSPLGMRLEVLRRRTRLARMPVVHGRHRPARSRLCIADDYLPEPSGSQPQQTFIT